MHNLYSAIKVCTALANIIAVSMRDWPTGWVPVQGKTKDTSIYKCVVICAPYRNESFHQNTTKYHLDAKNELAGLQVAKRISSLMLLLTSGPQG